MSQSPRDSKATQRHLPWLIDFRPEKAVELFFPESRHAPTADRRYASF
jgi:hypothetical protein